MLDERHPDRIVLARSGSPLIIGVGEHETHVASDLAAIVRHTSSVVHLDDGEFATITAAGFTSFTRDGANVTKALIEVTDQPDSYELTDHQHYMRKEFLEQPASADSVLRGRLQERFGTARLDGLNLDPRDNRSITRVKIIGCGSAFYVGQMGAQMIEELSRLPADAEAASEFRYRNPIIEPNTLYVAVSQSGETADTLFAVEEIKRKGGRVVGLVNVVGSSVARACDGGIYLHAGPEIAVASTKALTNMALAFALLALNLGRVRDLSVADGKRLLEDCRRSWRDRGWCCGPRTRSPASRRSSPGRAACSSSAASAATRSPGRAPRNSKRSPIGHAEAYPSSELKHGPLALITPECRPSRSCRMTSCWTGTSGRCTRSLPAGTAASSSPTRAWTSAGWRPGGSTYRGAIRLWTRSC